MARVYVDEDLSREYATLLSQEGHDVAYAVDQGTDGRSDAWHLARAALQQRVLLTFNERDFRFLHRLLTTLWVFQVTRARHEGILSATAQLGPTSWVPEVNKLLDSDATFAGRMLVWYPAQMEWREDAWRPEE